MSHLIEVAFKGNRKDFFLWESEDPPPLKSAVIVDADRGEDLGRVHAVGELAHKRNAGVPHGYGNSGTTKKARRLASRDDVRRADDLRAQDDDARRRAMERVNANKLAMKLSDAEWQWDRKKLTLYFTAEKRIDFRALVRELASMFRTRIELKQIGVRDEAKRLDGVGRCGRQYCSASWLPELRPVNLGVAKDQRLSLNPSQISGACGRLMCCLRYEHEFYVQSRKRFPKEGRVVRTKRGDEKVVANDIFRDRVTLRGDDGEQRTILLLDLRAEAEEVGAPLPFAPAPSIVTLDEHEEDIVLEEAVVAERVVVLEPAEEGGLVDGWTGEQDDDDQAETAESIDSGDSAISTRPPVHPSTGSPDDHVKRPRRRRGRRGGRRNRPGGGGRGPEGGPPEGTPPGAA
ncbi:MAG TPA: regulatory iron-sulfur-containing complex subunit RicT [Gemmatimonadaceae bacterium]|nr:regulatory iron-sulfur-containing complex subunit RicT [Gemmatimonadaceae bacterium]